MYLSRIELDLRRQGTMRALVSPSRFHGAIERAATDGRARKLWRIDDLRGKRYLLILSEKEEDWQTVADQFGVKEAKVETKCYDGLADRLVQGSEWHFLLRANPTIAKKGSGEEKERGKVLAHITEGFQKKWLMDRSQQHGFSLEEDEFYVKEQRWYQFYKGTGQHGVRVRLLAVTYEGKLSVTDADLFWDALTKGIGREKAFGMGMLTVVSGS